MRCNLFLYALEAFTILLVVGLMSSSAWADATITVQRDSTDFAYKYTGAQLVTGGDWGATPPGTVEGDMVRYQTGPGGAFEWGADTLEESEGWTVEVGVRITQTGAVAHPGVLTGFVSDGMDGQYNYIHIAADAVYAGINAEFDRTLISKNMTDGFHMVRIAQNPNSGYGDTHVWVDGQLVADDLKGLSTYAIQRHWWGKGSGTQTEGECLIQYLRVDTTGGYAPVPEPSGIVLLAAGIFCMSVFRRK